MSAITAWIRALAGAAVFCAIALALCPEGRPKRVLRAACGVVMAAALPSPQEFDKYVEEAERMDREKKNSPLMLEMRFENSELPALSAATLEKFVGFVVRQVEFAALSKNSGVSLLGVRDVFQQLEAALMWTGEKCRAKIIEALGFVC